LDVVTRFAEDAAVAVASPDEVRVMLVDISDQKQAEDGLHELNETLEAQVAQRAAMAERRAQALRRLAVQLSEAEHLERKRLAKLLHDDLQQLLLAIKLRLPVLVEGPRDQIEPHVEKLDELVGECLSTSRNLTQELSPPVLHCGTLGEAIEWLGQWFGDKHGLSVAVTIQDDTPPAPEPLRVFLFQTVRELLFNVVKHSGKMDARVNLSSSDGHLAVEVEDDGERFDPDIVRRSLDQSEGFGLFNIRERLESLLGRLEMDRTPHGGAHFRMIVPVAEVSASVIEDTMPEITTMVTQRVRESYAEGNPMRLLVVDDHAVVREGFVGLLARQPDFEVVGEAADGAQAVQQAEALQPDAVIMDVDMPTMDGVEATRRIKQRQPEMIVVGLSLHEEKGVSRAMAEAGADACVSKNDPAENLIDAIRQACL
jgi:signal transduction histidine kinase